MFKRMKLGTKLLLAFLAVGIIPFAIIGLTSLNKASNALEESSFNQLTAVQAIKKAQIQQFFAERHGDMNVLAQTVAALDEEGGGEDTANKVDEEMDEFFTNYIKEYGYYDLFLIEPNGKVYYSVTKEADFGTNMVNGKYADSNLGKLVRKVTSTYYFARVNSNGD